MQDTLHLSTTTAFPLPPNFSSKQQSINNTIHKNLQFPTLSSSSAASAAAINVSVPLPPKPLPSHSHRQSSFNNAGCHDFRDKMLFLDSIGIDFLSIASSHPHIAAASLSDLREVINFLTCSTTVALSTADLTRIVSMCPEILSLNLPSLLRVITFLQRDAGVQTSKLRYAIHRRPRLLVSSVETRLQPTLNFLKSIGVTDINRHTSLLSCSVEDKFIPRIEYLEKVGFSYKDTISMLGRFPPILRYSMEDNLEPKFNYFVMEMGRRELKELVDFPEYFSFSLENRIKARHRRCVDRGFLSLSLLLMLKSNEERFKRLLEVSCTSSSSVPLVRNFHNEVIA